MTGTDRVAYCIDQIEQHLTSPLDLEQMARQFVHYSPFYLIRLFRLLTGETPGGYLRKRRLSAAAYEIVETDKPIIEIAFDYQFSSHEAFSRSFKNHFGLSPFAQRNNRSFLHLTPRAVLWQSEVDPSPILPVQIIDHPDLYLAGLVYRGDNQDGGLAQIWTHLEQRADRMVEPLEPRRTFGLWMYPKNFRMDRNFDYLAAVEVGQHTALPSDMERRKLPATQYAVFEHHGPIQTIRRTYVSIYGKWLPDSDYRWAGAYDLEAYDGRFRGPDDPSSILSILVPIRSLF